MAAVLTHQQIAQLVNKKVASNQPLATSQKSVLQSSQPTAIGIDTSSTPFRTSNQSSTPVTTTPRTAQDVFKQAQENPQINQVIDNYMYYGSFPEEAVAKAKQGNSVADKAYVWAYENLISKPQEQSQKFSQMYIDGRSLRETNPINYIGKVLGNMGVGALGALSSIPAIGYTAQQMLNNPTTRQQGQKYMKEIVIPNTIESIQTDPVAGISQIGGAVVLGAATGTAANAITKGVRGVTKGIKGAKGATNTLKEAISNIDDPSAGLSAKQIASTALTDKNALSAIPGEITHTLTKGETKLRNTAQTALKTTSKTKHNELLAISQQTKQKNASAPVTVNVADVQTVYTGANQNSGFIVRIKQPTTGKKSTITEKFISAKPKDMSKRAGKTITRTEIPPQTIVRQSLGPDGREIIVQFDPSRNVYMSLKENGKGKYNYIGDLSNKQLTQLSKLDTNTGEQAKITEYNIINNPEYGRAKNVKRQSVKVPDKFYMDYKYKYGFNVVVENGKYRYTLIDQKFTTSKNYPTKIDDKSAGRMIRHIEGDKKVELELDDTRRLKHYQMNLEYELATSPNTAYLLDPIGSFDTLTGMDMPGMNNFYPRSQISSKTSSITTPYSEFYPTSIDINRMPPEMPGNPKIPNNPKSFKPQKETFKIYEGMVSDEVTLPKGVTNGPSYNKPIHISVNPVIKPIYKDIFLSLDRNGARPKANGRSVTPSTVNVKAAPTVKPRTAPKTNQKNASQPQQTTQAGAGIGLNTATIAGTTAGVMAVPLATATVTGIAASAVIDGTIPLPAVIPTTETISQVLDTATANSISTATSKSTAKSTSTTVSDSIADSTARSDITATTYDMSTPSAIPIAVSTALAIAGTGASSNGRNSTRKQTSKKPTENKVRRLRTPVKKNEKKTKKRIRLNLNTKADPRRKVTKTKKARKYVQVENYIPWLEEEEEITKWYMVDAKLMRTKQKITSAIKKAIEAYNTSATKYNGARKKLLSIIRTAGRTAKGKKAAEQLRKLYRDVKVKKARVTKAVKATK